MESSLLVPQGSGTLIREFSSKRKNMARHGDGAWVETAMRFGTDLPANKKARRIEVARRCNDAGVSEPLVSRIITAWQYAAKFIGQDELLASHKTVELLMQLERLDNAEAASVRLPVLRGEMTRAALDQRIRDVSAAQQAKKEGGLNLSLDDIVDRCLADLRHPEDLFYTQAPNGGVGYRLSADAELSYTEVDIDDNDNAIATISYKWALTISPHVLCSRIFGLGESQFILVIIALCQNYEMVSVFCSSEQERERVKGEVSRCAMPLAHHLRAGTKMFFHTFRP